jgi:hypothetical protein
VTVDASAGEDVILHGAADFHTCSSPMNALSATALTETGFPLRKLLFCPP